MASPKTKQTRLEIVPTLGGARRTIWANRLSVEWIEKRHVLATFGLLIQATGLPEVARVFIPSSTLEANATSLIQFLERLGTPEDEKAPLLTGAPQSQILGVADMIGMSSGQASEITFSAFCAGALTRKIQEAESGKVRIELDPFLNVRCERDTLIHFILQLYPNDGRPHS